VAAALREYEGVRRPPTAALQASSRAIGLLDTLPAPWHPLRDVALWFAGASGIAGKVFVSGALPRV
jgi:2-polyprenyl-6-methoxyphenol hydroxylase-like FAD-dependent oxidoreductase